MAPRTFRSRSHATLVIPWCYFFIFCFFIFMVRPISTCGTPFKSPPTVGFLKLQTAHLELLVVTRLVRISAAQASKQTPVVSNLSPRAQMCLLQTSSEFVLWLSRHKWLFWKCGQRDTGQSGVGRQRRCVSPSSSRQQQLVMWRPRGETAFPQTLSFSIRMEGRMWR